MPIVKCQLIQLTFYYSGILQFVTHFWSNKMQSKSHLGVSEPEVEERYGTFHLQKNVFGNTQC